MTIVITIIIIWLTILTLGLIYSAAATKKMSGNQLTERDKEAIVKSIIDLRKQFADLFKVVVQLSGKVNEGTEKDGKKDDREDL